jgi:asparagine synthase (glutamine-hydrolysing)
MKEHNGYEKGLLRSAMQGWLPDEVLWRKKSPYPKTHNPSYRAAVTAVLREIMADPDAPLLTLVRPEMLETLIGSNSPIPWYGQLMTTPQTIAYLIQLNYWMEKWKVKIRV